MSEVDLSIEDWCKKRNIAKAVYYRLKKNGHAPATIIYPGTRIIRVTTGADAEWERMMNKLRQSEEVKLAEERRQELASVAGRAAGQSPRGQAQRRRRRMSP